MVPKCRLCNDEILNPDCDHTVCNDCVRKLIDEVKMLRAQVERLTLELDVSNHKVQAGYYNSGRKRY